MMIRTQELGMARWRRFTLVEMLIVIAVLCVLASLLLPQLQSALEQTRRTKCASNQHQMYAAWTIYTNDFNDHMPAREFRNGNSEPFVCKTPIGAVRTWMVQYLGITKWVYWQPGQSERDISTPLDPTDPYATPNGDYAPYPKRRDSIVYCPSTIPNWQKFWGYPYDENDRWGRSFLTYGFFGVGVFYYNNALGQQYGGPRMENLGAGMGGRPFLFLGDLAGKISFSSGGHISTACSGWNHNDLGGNFTNAAGVTRWHDHFLPWGDAREKDWKNDPVASNVGSTNYPSVGYAIQEATYWQDDARLFVNGNAADAGMSLADKLRQLGYGR